MAIKKLSIEEFLAKAGDYPVIDVRSPGEYGHAHIPGAHNLPLFTNDERKVVGTTYKQKGREEAIKIGLDYFGVKMRGMVEKVEQIIGNWQLANATGNLSLSADSEKNGIVEKPLPIANCILIHCWRGGMRSAGVAWLLDLYGFEVYTLLGGYKAYRNWVLAQFEKDYDIKILGGYTGSGKTAVILHLKENGEKIIDLEGLANHKGSAFGGIGMPPQPSPEMFENLLAIELYKMNGQAFWMEDESQRIGILNIPHSLWKAMRT